MITLTIIIITLIKVSASAGIDFMPLEFDKQVKKIVLDDGRKKLILGYYKIVKEANKEIVKSNKGNVKAFWELTQNYSTTELELNDILHQHRQEKIKFQENNLTQELAIKKLLHQNEWDQILIANDEAFLKVEKSRVKALKAYDKVIEQLKSIVAASIEDFERVEEIQEFIDLHHTEKIMMLTEIGSVNYKENTVLRNLESSKEEHEEILQKMDSYTEQYFDHYISGRMKLQSLISEQEWKSIIKKFNDMYK